MSQPSFSTTESPFAGKAGWHIEDWCDQTTISRATLYTLPADLQPKSVKLGKRRIITEPPQAYLRRIAEESDSARQAA